MPQSLSDRKPIESNIHLKMYVLLVMIILVLATLQDYVYSILRNTGFHLSESALYNTIWIFLVPISLLDIFLQKKVEIKPIAFRVSYSVMISLVLTLLHITVFTSFFIVISHLAYTTPHRFVHMFSSALSNQSYILLFFYLVIPYLFQIINKRKGEAEETPEISQKVMVREGIKRVLVDADSIVYIESNKPYSIVHTKDKKYLCDDNLKKIEEKLNAAFLRVHRSIIVNKNCIVDLSSRKNGDYDARLANDQLIRMSRHFRQNWDSLIH